MSQQQQEIETKLEVRADVAVPDLSELPGVVAVDLPEELDLRAVYLDTLDLRLARAQITLRRRTGGTDAGWHLKLPVSVDERTELQAPLGSDDDDVVPAELAAAVRARTRGQALEPVAVLHTVRTVRRLRGAAGAVLAEIVDDLVTTSAPGVGEVHLDSWREWEVELVGGDRALLAAAVRSLEEVGAARPAWSSKLARALGGRLAAVAAGGAPVAAAGSAGATLVDYLRAQRDELLARDPQVRRDEPDGVHQLRIAIRRLRSVLATFRPLLVRERTDAVRGELGWIGGLLGAARDAEVARDHFNELITAEPTELVLGPVARRLNEDRSGAYRAAHAVVLAALDSPRYFALLDDLDALVDAPPFTAAAAAKAAKVLPARVGRDWTRLARAVGAARNAPAGPHRELLLHDARKAAKRVRYAGEVVSPAVGKPAMRSARAARKLADLLGRHHDSVEARVILRRVAARADLEGESAFTYGRLHALEQAHAEQIEEQLPALWEKASRGRRRRWMR